jgi:predicted kinase
MEAVILIGLQGSGKSTFYKARFFQTHVRISLDLLRTRYRESVLLDTCLHLRQPIVIDNTNPTREVRSKYIRAAIAVNYKVKAFYFRSRIEECMQRNENRTAAIPLVGILATAKKLELPSFDEGFESMSYVRLVNDEFIVEEWNNEV